jgi:hypothetical protein
MVHIVVYAGLGEDPFGFSSSDLGRARPFTNALLNSFHPRAISLGSARWSGRNGQLVVAPSFPAGGEAGGHITFNFREHNVYYQITLHAWSAAYGLTADNRNVMLSSGAPQVIATLKAIVGSALGG